MAARLDREGAGLLHIRTLLSGACAWALLDYLQVRPLLDLGMRLGEGSGAALALSVVRAAAALFTDMATFEGAGVSDKGA